MIVGSALKEGMFSSGRKDWATPVQIMRALASEFTFTMDACAAACTATAPLFFTIEDNALTRDWSGTVWMNPPYGKEIGRWVQKAAEEAERGCTVVCLLPSRTDTRWWHLYCMKAEIRFIRGRLRFDDQKNPAPFPSALVIFRKKVHG